MATVRDTSLFNGERIALRSVGKRNVMVLMESLAGTGHKLIRIRPKAAEKLEFLYKDPWVHTVVLYKEKKKLRTMPTRKSR